MNTWLTLVQSSDDDDEAEGSPRKDEAKDRQDGKGDKPKSKDKEKDKDKDSSKLASGASTRGNTTPSGRNKHSDPLKKGPATLKRPGSPLYSETSGTESSRKKSKKQHGSAPGTATPISRPSSARM